MDEKTEAEVRSVCWNKGSYKGGDRLKSLQQTVVFKVEAVNLCGLICPVIF